MRLPNADHAGIDQAKVRDYVLSLEHPVGRFKARFFGSLGFSRDAWDTFTRALREQHLTEEVDATVSTPYGQTFTIRAILRGPSGASAMVVSVWFIRTGEAQPRFVTAYPGGSK